MRRVMLPMMFVFAGCAKPDNPDTTPIPPLIIDADRNVKPDPEAGAMINSFAFDLFAELRKTEKGKNIFISPYSISAALGMTATGARGTTYEQMRKVLYLPDDTADAYYANLAAVLKGSKGYELNTANAVWAQGGKYPWDSFKNRLKGFGVIAFREVDFQSDFEAARKQVNDWAEKRTKEKIKELLKPKTIDRRTRMVLANAIYFKGQWATKFDPRMTREGEFTNADGSKSKLPFMSQNTASAEMSWNEGVRVLALPYVGNELQMVFVLPNEEIGLKSLEDKLNIDLWNQWMTTLQKSNVQSISVPKIKLETEYNLNKTLANQGMPDAFVDGQANFSGMTKAERLHISRVVHKAFVEINEDGTEASAASAVVMKGRGAITPFIVNRPFLFVIRHRESGAILFLGRVEKL